MELIFPFNGVNKGSMKSAQPKGTAYQARNVVPIDSLDGRIRGGQRPGLVDYSNIGQVFGEQITGISSLNAVWSHNGSRFQVAGAGDLLSASNYVKITGRTKIEFDLKGKTVAQIKVVTDGYEVDPTGNIENDSAAGLQAAIDDAFNGTALDGQTWGGLAILGAIIDLEGGIYVISEPLNIPEGSHVKFINGTLMPKANFTENGYMFQNTGVITGTTIKTCELVNGCLIFDNVNLYCGHIANGFKFIGGGSIYFINCHISRFTQYGIYGWGDGGIHGLSLQDVEIHQYDWEEVWSVEGERLKTPDAVGVYMGVYDSDITGCSIYLCGTGIQAARSSLKITRSHPWGCDTLISAEPEMGVDSVIAGLRIDGIYFDGGGCADRAVASLIIAGVCRDCAITNSWFTRPNNAPELEAFSSNFSFIHLGLSDTAGKYAGGRAERLMISGNTFWSDNPNEKDNGFTTKDNGFTTHADYNKDGSLGCIFDNNQFNDKVWEFRTTEEYQYAKFENDSEFLTFDIANIPNSLVRMGYVTKSDIDYRVFPKLCGGIVSASGGNLLDYINNRYVIVAAANVNILNGTTVIDGTYYIPVKNTSASPINITIFHGAKEDTETPETPAQIAAGASSVVKVVVAEGVVTATTLNTSMSPTYMHIGGRYYGVEEDDIGKYSIGVYAYDGINNKNIDGYFNVRVTYG